MVPTCSRGVLEGPCVDDQRQRLSPDQVQVQAQATQQHKHQHVVEAAQTSQTRVTETQSHWLLSRLLMAAGGRREAGASLLPVRLNMKETLIETVYELL